MSIYPQTFAQTIFHRWITGLKLLACAIVLSALWIYSGPIGDLLAIAGDRQALLETLGGHGTAGPFLIFVVLSLQVLLAAIPGHFVMVVSGYLYGFALAFLVTHASTVLASQFAYWLARRYGRPIVDRLAPKEVVDRWTHKAERQGMVFFFFAFVLPIFPSDVMNFVAGLSGLSSKKFLVANFIGRMPTSILFSLIGAQGFRITLSLFLAALVYTAVMLVAWRKLSPILEGRVDKPINV